MKPINKGSLWLGKTWKEAIKLSLETSDCGIEPKYKTVFNSRVFEADKKVFVGYQMFGYGNRKKYKTKIPKTLNKFVEKQMELIK